MTRIADRFSEAADHYDASARVQPVVAAHLAAQLAAWQAFWPQKILEIGCGTGGLSAHLLQIFPDAELVLSDISPSMLALCQRQIGEKPIYRQVDTQNLPPDLGSFDLIVSSLALQWVEDLPSTLNHLIALLNPGGRLAFAVLGNENFKEWSQLLLRSGAPSGLHSYPSAETFCWPEPYKGLIEQEFLYEQHESGAAFLKSLKQIGAATPHAAHKPIPVPIMKRILKASETGFRVSYHILYGDVRKSDLD